MYYIINIINIMNPNISETIHNGDIYEFRLSNIDVSLANALRRIILSEIPTYVFNTEMKSDHSNDCTIDINTGRLHNEIVKQRLACIPIHRKVPMNKSENDMFAGKYMLELDVENTTENIIYVTTDDFKIKNKENGNYLTKEETMLIFPKNVITQSYIDFLRLRPKISDNIPGERIKLACEISVSNARNSSMFNVVSNCTYFNTIDKIKKDEIWEKQKENLLENNATSEEIEFQRKNFEYLDAQRYFIKDSFDFTIETLGVYDNIDIIKIGCVILQNKFVDLIHSIDADIVPITISETTMDHCYDITLEGEDYTVGKVLEYLLYDLYYVNEKKLSYCGFKKFHPHDSESIIRVAFMENMDKTHVRQCFRSVCVDAQEAFKKLYAMF